MANILLLDDDAAFRLIVTTCLGRMHTVVEVSRCKEADAQVQKRSFDLLLVDGLLPDGDGRRWIENFRQGNAMTPVLFISSFWKGEASIKKIPNVGILQKPIVPAELLAKVDSALRSSGFHHSLPPEAQTALDLMRAAYGRDLPDKVKGVRTAVAELRRNAGSVAVRGVARRRAHQVAGTAGSFGYDEIGNACAEIEQAILSLEGSAPEGWEGKLDRAIAGLGGVGGSAQPAAAVR